MNINTIKAGTTLTARSACDSDCVFRAEVLSRTAKTATVRIHGTVKRCGIKVYDGAEFIMALGSYSMAPVFRADRVA